MYCFSYGHIVQNVHLSFKVIKSTGTQSRNQSTNQTVRIKSHDRNTNNFDLSTSSPYAFCNKNYHQFHQNDISICMILSDLTVSFNW